MLLIILQKIGENNDKMLGGSSSGKLKLHFSIPLYNSLYCTYSRPTQNNLKNNFFTKVSTQVSLDFIY